jgi:hypothetical protein
MVANDEIQNFGDQAYTLKEENDKSRDEFEHVREDERMRCYPQV